MAVIVKWICDRDDSMFASKKEAEAYDKMLELGEQFTALLDSQIPNIDPQQAEAFGILLAKHKDLVMEACKGKPDALEKITQEDGVVEESSNVQPLMAEAGS